MLKDVALSTGVFAGAAVGVAVGSAGGFTGAEGVVGAGFAGAFLLLTVTLHLYVFLPTLALIYAVPFFFAVTTPFLLTVATDFFVEDHFTFFFVPFTFKRYFLPWAKVSFVLFSLIFAALTDVVSTARHITTSKNVVSSTLAFFNDFLPFLISIFSFLINNTVLFILIIHSCF